MKHTQSNDPNAYRGQAQDQYRQDRQGYQQGQQGQQGYQQGQHGQHGQHGQQGYQQGHQGHQGHQQTGAQGGQGGHQSTQQPAQQYPQSSYGQQSQPTQSQQYTQQSAQPQHSGQPRQSGQMPPTGQTQQMGQPGSPQQAGGMQGQMQAQGQTQPTARGPRLQPITIEDIVATDIVTAERSTPIQTIVAKMAENNVGSVVIVEDETPVGIITDRQVALALESTPDIADREADDLLTEDLVTGTTEMTVFEVLGRLTERGIRRLPIVSEDGALEGIVSLDDILVLLGSELNNATEVIQQQSPRL